MLTVRNVGRSEKFIFYMTSDPKSLENLRLSKLIELGKKINDIISNKQINNIHDMRIFKSKLDSLRSILSHDDFAFTGKVKSIFSEFYDVSDVSYYYPDMTKSQLEKAKESLVYIERAIDSILK